MEIDLFALLDENHILMIFSLLGLGLLVGKIRIKSVEVGPTAGVLLVGLLFGHLGFAANPMMATFGFTIFIFAVGLQAGPSFFSVFLADGVKYVVLAVVVAGSAVAAVLLIASAIDLEYGMSAGLLAGSLTSTPTLAGAQDAITSGLASFPDGMDARKAAQNVSVGYAITYIFGTIGLIVFIRYFPSLAGIDLPQQARELAAERGFGKQRKLADDADNIPIIRAYRILPDSAGKTVAEISARPDRRILGLRIRRDGGIIEASADVQLQAGDVISVIGSLGDHARRDREIGEEILDPDLLNYDIVTKEVVVISPDVIGRPLSDLKAAAEYGCFVRAVRRASVDLPVYENMVINKGDRLQVTGEHDRLNEFALRVGRIDAEDTQTNLLAFSLGIGGGVMLGMFVFKLGGVSVGLGSAGGLLLIGILLGYLQSVYPSFTGVPPAARRVLMEFGLVLFMAGVGLRAGAGIVEGFVSAGPRLILAGILVTLTPVLVGYVFGRKVLKMNPAILLGGITGAMTSTPALNVVNEAAKSEIPSLGYAGTYTFANVLLTFAGSLLMML